MSNILFQDFSLVLFWIFFVYLRPLVGKVRQIKKNLKFWISHYFTIVTYRAAIAATKVGGSVSAILIFGYFSKHCETMQYCTNYLFLHLLAARHNTTSFSTTTTVIERMAVVVTNLLASFNPAMWSWINLLENHMNTAFGREKEITTKFWHT